MERRALLAYQQRGEANRHRQAQLDEQIVYRLPMRAVLKAIELLHNRGQKRQKLLVKMIVRASADEAEKRAQQHKVWIRVAAVQREARRLGDDAMKIRLKTQVLLVRTAATLLADCLLFLDAFTCQKPPRSLKKTHHKNRFVVRRALRAAAHRFADCEQDLLEEALIDVRAIAAGAEFVEVREDVAKEQIAGHD